MTTTQASLVAKLRYRVPQLKLCLVHEGFAAGKLYSIGHPGDAEEFLEPLCHASEEHFVTLHLNARNEIIGLHEVSHGTLAASLVHPREVFKAALLANSYAILLCHNHPSGAVIEPSPEDMHLTRQLISAAKVLNVSLLDHLIVSPNQAAYSLREHFPHIWKVC